MHFSTRASGKKQHYKPSQVPGLVLTVSDIKLFIAYLGFGFFLCKMRDVDMMIVKFS